MTAITAPAATTSPARAYRRRWFQFSLRTLLVVVTLVGAGCGWLALKLQAVREQQRSVEYLNKLSAHYSYDYQRSDAALDSSGEPQPPGPQWLRKIVGDEYFCNVDNACLGGEWNDETSAHLRGLHHLQDLELGWSNVGDAGLANLEQMQELERLGLPKKVSDTGLEHLRNLHSLQNLSAYSQGITDAGLKHLSGLVHLKSLGLRHTQLTGATLGELRNLSELETLVLDGSPITDDGLENLPRLPKLQEISLQDTQVTDAGIARLQAKLPNCKIKQ